MFKKSLLLMLLMALLAPWAAKGQTLTVYEGDDASTYVPVIGYYTDNYGKCEFVMLADSLTDMNGMAISKMKFNITAIGSYGTGWNTGTFQVFMKEINASTISAYQGTTDATIVYEGAFANPAVGDYEITFTNEYEYHGGNLLIGIYRTVKGNYKDATFKGKSVTGASLANYSSSSLASVSATQRNFVPKTTFTYHEPPTCPKPTNLHANLTEGNGAIATLVWTETGTASNWEVIYGTDPTLETHSAPITTGFNVDGSTISCNLTGLTAETPHYAKVKAVCEAGVDESEYTDIIEFIPSNFYTKTVNNGTSTNSYVPLYYYYVANSSYYTQSASQFIIPADSISTLQWGKISKLTFYNSETTVNYNSAQFAIYVGEVDVTTQSSYTNWNTLTNVYTGTLNVSDNKMEITFSDPFTYQGGNLLIGMKTSTKGTSQPSSNNWYGKSATSGASLYTTYNISSYNKAQFLPKVTFSYLEGEAPSCLPVSNLSFSNEQATSVDLNWNAGGSDETAWKLQYKKTTEDDWTTYPSAITEKPFTLPNLSETTTYQWQVAAWCDTSDPDGISDYVAGTNFTTKQTPVVVEDSWSDNFEGVSCGWQLINGECADIWAWGTATNNGGTHALYISDDNGTTNHYSHNTVKVFAAKLFTFTNDGKFTFAYDWKAKGESTCDFLRVALVPSNKTLTAGSDYSTIGTSSLPTDWIALDGGGILNLNESWQTKEATINVTAGSYYVVFIWRSDTSTQNQPPAAVDNFSITRVACGYDVAGLEVATEPAPTAHTATINWTNGDPGSWQVAWSKDNTFAPANTQTETVNTNTINLVNLDAASTYYVKVRAYCGGEDYGAWCEAIDFPTECEAISDFPWSYNFNTDATGNFSKLCWINDIVSGSYKFRVSSSANGSNSTNQLYMDYHSGSVAKLVLPELAIPTGKTYQFVIDVYRTTYSISSNDGIRVYANTSRDLEGATELGFLYRVCSKTDGGVVTAETTTGWYTYTFDIPYNGSCFVILKGEGQGGNSTYVDNFVIRQTPDCATPTGLAVTANSATPEGATITWDNVAETSWIVEYKKTADEDWTAIAAPVSTNTYTFVGLDASTSYQARIKVNCSTGDGVTYPTDPVQFTTDVDCPAPKNLVVNSVTDVTATFSWTAGYNETEWTVKYKKHADAEYTTAEPNPVLTNSITINGLTGGTAYDVQIIGCEPTHIYTVTNAFTTAYSTPFAEPFDASSRPANWANYVGLLTDNVLNGTTPLTSGTGQWTYNITRVFGAYHAVDNIYGSTSCKDWLVTPNIIVGSGMSLSFDLALTDYGSADPIEFSEGQADDKFIVLISTDNAHTWTILRQWDNAGSEYVYNEIEPTGETVYIDLNSYSGQTIRIAFYGESTVAVSGEDNDMHIDNVEINTTPSCYRPSALKASAVTNHSATLTWNPGSDDQTAWEFKYNIGEDFNPAEAGTLVENITANPYTFDKTLDAASTYYFYVRGNCGGEPSAWSKKVCSFTTEAAAPAPTIFAKTEVGPDWVDLYWNAPAGDYLSGYGIYCTTTSTEPDAETPATVTITDATAPTSEAPYRLPGLDNETTYYLWVRANHETDVYSAWKAITGSSITTLEACPAPTVNEATDITQISANISWTGTSDDYMVQYASVTTKFFEGFEESTSLDSWSTLDKDGDATTKIARSSSAGYNSDYGVRFEWTQDPPLYLISPDLSSYITVSGLNLEFYYKNNQAGNTNYPETFCVGFSSTDNEIASFDFGGEITANDLQWHQYSNSIPAGTKYIAIKLTSDDQYYLDIDDFNIVQTSAWTTAASAVQSPYTIDALTNDTKYNVKVIGNCGGTPSSDSNIISFNTLAEGNKVFAGADGNWSNADNWIPSGVPTIDDDVIIRANVTVSANTTALANNITFEGTTTPTLTINDGGQLQHGNNVTAMVKKNVTGYSSDNLYTNNRYILLASPIVAASGTNPTNVTGLITDDNSDPDNRTYDLYSWAGSEDLEWRNYRTSTFNLYNGKAYLYANLNNVELTFNGTIKANHEDVNVTLSYGTEGFSAWNLVGNPFVCDAYMNDATDATIAFYRMNEAGNGFTAATGAVKPMEGIFVQATADSQSFNWSKTYEDGNSKGLLNVNLTQKVNSRDAKGDTDNAIIRFDGGNSLEKFSFSDNTAKVFIPQDNKDYAVINAETQGELPVSFKAEKNGSYTLSFTSENVVFSYLHLIDLKNNNDVDLLANPSYSFDARINDLSNRFKLVFKTSENDNEGDNFGFVSNGNLMILGIDGQATVQVFDVTGRMLSSETFSGSYNKAVEAANGVYMIRLIQGENVRTQKIVIK